MWNPVPWAKENLLEQTKQLAKEHPECHFFVTLGDGAKDFSEEEVAPNVTVVSYLPTKNIFRRWTMSFTMEELESFINVSNLKNLP